MKSVFIDVLKYSIFLGCALMRLAYGQSDQWIDSFQKDLCHNRWMQMDWQSILRPCRNKMQFGKAAPKGEMPTSPQYSHTTGLNWKKAGEWSKLTIQSRTADGTIKKTGGDTWRLFIRGERGNKGEFITPFVSDLNNGVYEAKFMMMTPGYYKAEIVLESTQCEAFKDPPQDWLKRDAVTILGDEKNSKLLWQPLRGGNISFKIEKNTDEHMKSLQRQFYRWKNQCGPQYKCPLLWKGFGRWTNNTWQPYVDDKFDPNEESEAPVTRAIKQKEGVLKFSGDFLTRSLRNFTKTTALCSEVFQSCEGSEAGEQPEDTVFARRDNAQPNTQPFSTKPYSRSLKALMDRPEMDENSGLLINYGKPFVENMSFKQYRSFIDHVARILKEKYKGKAVWRTLASSWRESEKPEEHFLNHQRAMLFNAYATSKLCNAGIPTLDVFQMTESAPHKTEEEVVEAVNEIITEYYKDNPAHPETAKKSSDADSNAGEVALTGGLSPANVTAALNAAHKVSSDDTSAAGTWSGMLIPQSEQPALDTDESSSLNAAMEDKPATGRSEAADKPTSTNERPSTAILRPNVTATTNTSSTSS